MSKILKDGDIIPEDAVHIVNDAGTLTAYFEGDELPAVIESIPPDWDGFINKVEMAFLTLLAQVSDPIGKQCGPLMMMELAKKSASDPYRVIKLWNASIGTIQVTAATEAFLNSAAELHKIPLRIKNSKLKNV